MTKPVVRIEEDTNATRVRVVVGSAEVWIRATPGGRRLEVAIEEGEGEVDVQWSIRRTLTHEPIVQTGPFVQSPYPVRDLGGRPPRQVLPARLIPELDSSDYTDVPIRMIPAVDE